MWLAKPDAFSNSESLHCDGGKLNIDTSVGRFNVLDQPKGLDHERKGNWEGSVLDQAPSCAYDIYSSRHST